MREKLEYILKDIDHTIIGWKAEIYDRQKEIDVLGKKINSLLNHRSATERVMDNREDNK